MAGPLDASPVPPVPARSGEGLVRAIGVGTLAANGVNLTIGAGIFVLPATVAAMLGPAGLVAYVVCALVMGIVLTCFAEVGSRIQRSGGLYAYVETALGPYAGFVSGTLLWFGFGILPDAAVANALVGTLATVHPGFAHPVARVAFLAVLFGGLAWINILGVRQGARFAVTVTLAKLLPLLVLIAFGLPAVRSEHLAWSGWPSFDAVGSAALILFFAFGGAECALSASGEIRDPARTVPRAILLAVATVLVFYLLLQLVAQGVLGPELPGQKAPLVEVAGRILDGPGRVLLLVGSAISMFGLIGGDLLAQPRALFAQARDGFFFAAIGRVHPLYRTPYVALAVYALLQFVLATTGAFERLAALASAGLLLNYLSLCVSALVLRRRGVQEAGTPFRAPGGPLFPLLGIGVVFWLLTNTTRSELLGLTLMVGVASLAYVFRRKDRTYTS